MRNVSLVGRIGALAIALGVASALGTMPPPALAQPADSTSSSTTSAESSDSSPAARKQSIRPVTVGVEFSFSDQGFIGRICRGRQLGARG